MSTTPNPGPNPPAEPTAAPEASKPRTSKPDKPHRVFLVPYPKIVFLYPTFIAALVATVFMGITGKQTVGPEDISAVIITWIFLAVFAMNLMVMTFDFPRATSLTMFFFLAAIVLGAVLTFTLRPNLLPAMADVLKTIRPVANTTFFATLVVMMSCIFCAVLVSVRFDYWEVRHNELLHHHGVLSDLKRFSSPNLRIDKEINDVFEFLLLGSGRLILQPSGERRESRACPPG